MDKEQDIEKLHAEIKRLRELIGSWKPKAEGKSQNLGVSLKNLIVKMMTNYHTLKPISLTTFLEI